MICKKAWLPEPPRGSAWIPERRFQGSRHDSTLSTSSLKEH
jgi:hypothetical protein